MKYTAITLFAAIALASAPALAHRDDARIRAHYANPDMKIAAKALEVRDDALQRESTAMKIGAVDRQQIAEQRREIRKLQQRLESGQHIDRYTLYHALGSDYPNYFAS
jgi:hypothetical protein